ncbi:MULTISPECIES: Atu4866 domain-containing protein [unclassified Sinorhizobium]|uniref:Atu4866 domain-containing protein n=1 Tax=unclassified Sinorhizobium TaxID=2613772 RepID=UPI0024C25DEC|nr:MULTISPECIES: Atu4866 domain-containing protein [unclassified Sinorhizobium]MDK1374559.1 Atu4866 domain-containing protein [Sinorhizobium sp. 6-70]MDK1478241.1 Atu4866 domain-containing protein [Sinorhizobium sp. 6-117]
MSTTFSKNLALGPAITLLATCASASSASGEDRIHDPSPHQHAKQVAMASHPYVGMWVTDDGYVRHELLANGRYDEARGTRKSAYQGRYEVSGKHIEYWDDTGFTADGDFVDENTLHHGGMILRRR